MGLNSDPKFWESGRIGSANLSSLQMICTRNNQNVMQWMRLLAARLALVAARAYIRELIK